MKNQLLLRDKMVPNSSNFVLEKGRILDMNNLLLISYEFLTVALLFFITYFALNLVHKKKGIHQTKGRFLKLSVFIIYIFGVFYFTGVGTIFDLQRYGIQLNADQINLVPFSRDIDTTAYVLNLLLFVPFGFLLPFVWPNIKKLSYVVFSGFSFSLLVEISQLFNNRQTDIDDLILNTLGTLMGYLLFHLFMRASKRMVKPVTCLRVEPAIYILATFLGHFLLFNEFGAAKVLYGF